jgi:hypothetical protein
MAQGRNNNFIAPVHCGKFSEAQLVALFINKCTTSYPYPAASLAKRNLWLLFYIKYHKLRYAKLAVKVCGYAY